MLNGWKTALVSLLITIFGAVQAFLTESVEMSSETNGIVMMAIGAVMAILRYMTTTPIFKSDE